MQKRQLCCSHVYTGERDVLLVTRTESNFEFLCGEDHSDTDFTEFIDVETLIKRDNSLKNIQELKSNHRLERKSKNADWILKYMPCVDLNYIKGLNSAYINDVYGLLIEYLPILNVDTCSTKTALQVRKRAFLLSVLVQVSFGHIAAKDAENYLRTHKLYEILTKKEKSFLAVGDEEQLVDFTWKSEGLYALLWCLGIEAEIADANTLADLNEVPAETYPFINLQTNPNHFLNNDNLTLRSSFATLFVLDYFSRLDYIGDIYTISNKELPINTALVYERRYALLWLHSNINWDNIKCNSIIQ